MTQTRTTRADLISRYKTLMDSIEDGEDGVLPKLKAFAEQMNVSEDWLTRIELGIQTMSDDGKITPEETAAIIDMASKTAFLDTTGLDQSEIDYQPFVELLANENVLLKNEQILAENERILAANQRILDSGSNAPLQELNDLKPL